MKTRLNFWFLEYLNRVQKVLADNLDNIPASQCVKKPWSHLRWRYNTIWPHNIHLQLLLSLSQEYYNNSTTINRVLCQKNSSKLNYSYSLFIDILDYLMAKFQCVQKAAARMLLNLKQYDFETPHLMILRWLTIRQRMIYKVDLIVFKVFNGDAYDYI